MLLCSAITVFYMVFAILFFYVCYKLYLLFKYYTMWILLLTWMSLQSSGTAQLNTEILYSYDTKEDCEWAKEWVLENNEPSKNPTMRAICVTRRDAMEQVPNQEQADRP